MNADQYAAEMRGQLAAWQRSRWDSALRQFRLLILTVSTFVIAVQTEQGCLSVSMNSASILKNEDLGWVLEQNVRQP